MEVKAQGACVRGGKEGTRDRMCEECAKLKHGFESDSRQCCIIGLKIKQLDRRNVWIKKFGHLHDVLYS